MDIDSAHAWHPYSSIGSGLPVYPVASASGVRLKLADGRELIDGMASWWSVIHGYNNPCLNQAIKDQLEKMAHVMFGGLSHEPAMQLVERLVRLSPEPLQCVFLSDSGSVSVEVALKMAIQYWHALGQPEKHRFLTLKNGYHGDTFGAMSVCDPVTGMHSLFAGSLMQQHFVDPPKSRFGDPGSADDIVSFEKALAAVAPEVAAVILEPIVQGTGGMNFYSADYLAQVRALCDQYEVLLIADEIATGFGRTGKLFACEHAGISPDIMCLGKTLTGGYLTLAATLTTRQVSDTINQGDPGLFMHGPTFMANALACATAVASIDMLLASPWQERISSIEQQLKGGLGVCAQMPNVADVRVLGAIGVIELKDPVDMKRAPQMFVDAGVWVRPFGKLVYLMPPYVISEEDLTQLCSAVVSVVEQMS